MHPTPDVSVIIVSYNTRELLRECIESILCAQGDDAVAAEVIVVDNASADGSAAMVAERFPKCA
jgi:N-acetylglucosaminyl-diphospho-decaprenol L-rhamnosyltransferase